MRTERKTSQGGLSDDVFSWVLEEGERALLDVEARIDEPGLRLPSVDVEAADREVLEVALAEWVDAHPGLQYELEAIGDRLRTVGVRAAAEALEEQPHVVEFLRMSLEVFSRIYPSPESFERDYERHEESGESNPIEVWQGLRQVMLRFRKRMS